MLKDLEAVLSAIHHYKSEVKQNKDYAKPILQGLYLAQKKLEKYNEIIEKLVVID